MIRIVVYSCRLHIRHMFDEIPVMASMGPVKGLLNYFHLHHCFIDIFLF